MRGREGGREGGGAERDSEGKRCVKNRLADILVLSCSMFHVKSLACFM